MTRLIILLLTLGLLAACKGDSHAQQTDSTMGERVQMADAATAVDSPISDPDSQPKAEPVPDSDLESMPARNVSVRSSSSDGEPQDTLKPKSVQMKKANDFLRKHIKDESVAKEIQIFLEEDEKVSAVRKVSEVTSLGLPEAKAFVDSLDVLMGTDKVNITPRAKIERKKRSSY
jgi:hypothetical protein